jgi:DNA-binding NarL/FixJ family response regulator
VSLKPLPADWPIWNLQPESLKALARYFRSMAALCLARARELEAKADERRRIGRRFGVVTDLPPDTWIRDREILRLASLGYTNERIAVRLRCHRNTVSRAIQRALARSRAHPAYRQRAVPKVPPAPRADAATGPRPARTPAAAGDRTC